MDDIHREIISYCYTKLGWRFAQNNGKKTLTRWKDPANLPALPALLSSTSLGVGISVTTAHSGLVVVDQDDAAAMDWFRSEHADILQTVSARTGGGGAHHYYTAPDGIQLKTVIRYKGMKLDIKAGMATVCCPPSKFGKGAYTWINSPLDIGIMPAPGWLIEACKKPNQIPLGSIVQQSLQEDQDAGKVRGYIEKAITEIAIGIQTAPDGTRNHVLNKAAFRIGSLIAGSPIPFYADGIRAEMQAAAIGTGLTPAEVRATWDSGFKDGMDHPMDFGDVGITSRTSVNAVVLISAWAEAILNGELTDELTAEALCELIIDLGYGDITPKRVGWLMKNICEVKHDVDGGAWVILKYRSRKSQNYVLKPVNDLEKTTPAESGVVSPEKKTTPAESGVVSPEKKTTPAESGVVSPEKKTTPAESGVVSPEKKTTPAESGVVSPEKKTVKIIIDNESKAPDLRLPCDARTFSDAAKDAFWFLGGNKMLFHRAGVVVDLTHNEIRIIRAPNLQVILDRHFKCLSSYVRDGETLWKPKRPTSEICTALLAAQEEIIRYLPPIKGVMACPIMTSDGRILSPGYDAETGWFIAGGSADAVSIDQAVNLMDDILDSFEFRQNGDRARCIAAILTPAMKFAGAFRHAPMTLFEANESQTGKTFLASVIAAIYREEAQQISQTNGKIGSLDESVAARLAAGRPFVLLDNLRGELDSMFLENLLTANGDVSTRIAYSPEIKINATDFVFFATSNGIKVTEDLANRINIVRILRRPEDHRFRAYPEGDLLAHVKANQGKFLGAVFSIVKAWLDNGKPETDACGHDAFAQWRRVMDWISQDIMLSGSVTEGAKEAVKRLSDDNMTFVRKISEIILREGNAGVEFSASTLMDLADNHNIFIPRMRDRTQGPQTVGRIMAGAFGHKDNQTMTLENIRITRAWVSIMTSRGDNYMGFSYKFMQDYEEEPPF